MRGTVDAPGDPSEDDVLDPAGRSWNTYETSMSQLLPAVEEVARVIRAAVTPSDPLSADLAAMRDEERF